MVRTWLITDSFPNVCPCFQLTMNQREPNMLPYQFWIPCLYSARLQLPQANSLHSACTHLKPSLFCTVKLCHSSLGLWVSAKMPVTWQTPCTQAQNSLCFSHLVGLHLFLQSLPSLTFLFIVTFGVLKTKTSHQRYVSLALPYMISFRCRLNIYFI